MSEKKLKQMRLPFQILTSPKTPPSTAVKSVEKSSPSTPKTPKPISTRKRKPSTEGENLKSTKIGRLTNAKENIAEPETIELVESDDEGKKKAVETTPSTSVTPAESVVHIKLPSTTKSRRKQELKPSKPSIEIVENDDSVVYLDEEELPAKKSKKSVKKSEKKKKSKTDKSSEESVKRVRKSLKLNEEISESPLENDSDVIEKSSDPEEDSKIEEEQHMEIDDPQPIVSTVSDQISQLINASGTSSSPVKDIQDILSGDENETSPLNDSLNTSFNQSIDNKTTPKALTPKQLARRKEFEDRRLQKELQKKQERDAKELQRLKEKEQREELKRREKEEKDELRRKEKEEREQKRLAEEKKKEDEKRQKEEERKRLAEQKEEEKRLKEEDRKKRNEALDEEKKKKEAEKLKLEERKKKTAEAFTKFFVPTKKKATTPLQDDETSKDSADSSDTLGKSNFMPFQVREQMRLAPCVRYRLDSNELNKLDSILAGEQNDNASYLKELKNGNRVPKSSGKTWPQEERNDDDDDIIVIDELQGVGEDIKEDDAHLKMKHRAKFLLFTENRRPAFKGTWRKKTSKISARKPFAQDLKYFDYEIDSDDEWEEEEPGESLHGSDSEKEKDVNEEEYEVDNDFFVPHGHLSDDEMNQSGEGEIDDNSPEAQKAKLKILQQEFAAEMKKKTEKIKPRLIGCIWMNGDEDEDGATMKDDLEKKYHCSSIIWRILKAREMWSSNEEIKMEEFEPELPEPEEEAEKPAPAQQKTPAQQKVRPKIESEESIKDLIRLVHGNTNSKKYIIREYQAYRLKNLHKNADFQEFSVKSVDEKMMEISVYKTCPDDGPMFGKKCWYVKSDIAGQYFGDEQLPLPNQWNYILEKEPKRPKPIGGGDVKKGSREVSPDDSAAAKTSNEPPFNNQNDLNIQSVKVVRDSPKPAAIVNRAPISSSSKKRVQLLMSVPRGSKVDEEKKNNLISQYLSKNNQMSSKPQEKVQTNVTDDGIVEIID